MINTLGRRGESLLYASTVHTIERTIRAFSAHRMILSKPPAIGGPLGVITSLEGGASLAIMLTRVFRAPSFAY
jgi:hypothetical protein